MICTYAGCTTPAEHLDGRCDEHSDAYLWSEVCTLPYDYWTRPLGADSAYGYTGSLPDTSWPEDWKLTEAFEFSPFAEPVCIN